MATEPVPFQLALPGRDTLGFDGARSVSYRVHGLLHLEGDTFTFEWSTARHVEHVSLTRVHVDDHATPPELLDVPVTWIADARVTGGWWAPRLVLRARRLDAFDGVPGAEPGSVALRIARRDRAIAAAMVDALTAARALGPAHYRPLIFFRDPLRRLRIPRRRSPVAPARSAHLSACWDGGESRMRSAYG
jgi:hypothetical protein